MVNLLADVSELVKAMKKAARDERESSKPVNVFFGAVLSINPLKINVEQKMVLGEAQLVLARNVTDYSLAVSIDCLTDNALGTHSHSVNGADGGGDAINLTTEETGLVHNHKISGKKKITVHSSLVTGDKVILIRQQEGQKFVVIDRIGGKP